MGARTSKERSEVLQRLDRFVGRWEMSAVFPANPDAVLTGATASFEWVLDGRFLVEEAQVPSDQAPDSLAIYSADESAGTYTQHYFDSRGVIRLYAMTFDGMLWTLTRTAADFTPLEFSQRYTGRFSEDGRDISGAWESSNDGATWEKDFDLKYSRTE